ncbi:hypothetical protein K435DRAFT_694121 [Dendrothele bispora CBS 962.96]|uniref:Uncharacterized protein n=2 Tax=Dendrothele bispora (strain CBS 962.96) TaxID=1314807 RepID=A0A4S8KYW9_DENBC|nr:hypothetical protein K435DRAFT_694121 [Dendrothele bispora CBS 962.96]
MKEYLVEDLESYPEWMDAIESLVSLEASFKFNDFKKILPTTKRPVAVPVWVKNARKESCPKKVGAVETFRNEVLVWWNTMQPDWRILDKDDLDTGEWVKEVKGQWGKLRCPGINGLYSVMACLRWWAVSEIGQEGRLSEQWTRLLQDVVWVMDAIAGEEEQPPTKKSRPSA